MQHGWYVIANAAVNSLRMWQNSHKWGKYVNVNVPLKVLYNRICACIHVPDGRAAVGSRGALRFDSPGSKISYILILYSANCKIANWLIEHMGRNYWTPGPEGARYCSQPVFTHNLSWPQPRLGFWHCGGDQTSTLLPSRWMCRFLWDHTNMEESYSSLIFGVRGTV